MRARLSPFALLSAVFVLGGIAGAGASRAYTMHELHARFRGPPGEVRARLHIEAMRRQLDLSAEQVAKIEAIFDETDGELERRMKPCREELEALRARTDARIAEVLEPGQRARFQEHIEKRRRHHLGGPFPPPPGLPPPPP